jgi:replication-associated recombination protein RarA
LLPLVTHSAYAFIVTSDNKLFSLRLAARNLLETSPSLPLRHGKNFSNMTRKKQLLKVILLGDSGVGKTSLMHQVWLKEIPHAL